MIHFKAIPAQQSSLARVTLMSVMKQTSSPSIETKTKIINSEMVIILLILLKKFMPKHKLSGKDGKIKDQQITK